MERAKLKKFEHVQVAGARTRWGGGEVPVWWNAGLGSCLGTTHRQTYIIEKVTFPQLHRQLNRNKRSGYSLHCILLQE